MATKTTSRARRAAAGIPPLTVTPDPVTPTEKAMFMPKRKRKALRKMNFKNAYANAKAAREVESESRREFRRTLKLVKLRRAKIVKELRVLAAMVKGLEHETVSAAWRVGQMVSSELCENAVKLVRKAAHEAESSVDDMFVFSKAKVHYVRKDRAA